MSKPSDPALLTQFEIERELGRGGMGIVYLAHQKSLGRRVALKVLHCDEKSAASLLARFRREAMNMVRLKHPHLVHLYDFDASGPNPYLVVELIEGDTSLKDLIEEATTSFRDSLVIGLELASAVAYLHEHGIVHRDLKPANVLMDLQRHPRLADFGISRDLDPNTTQLTMDGQIVGTFAYMAPEQAFGEPASTRSDVYSLGLVLFEILARKLVFGGTRPVVTPPQRFNSGAPSLLRHCERAAGELDRLLTRCLAHNAANRPADAREVLAVLSRFVERELGKDTGQKEVVRQQIAKYTAELKLPAAHERPSAPRRDRESPVTEKIPGPVPEAAPRGRERSNRTAAILAGLLVFGAMALIPARRSAKAPVPISGPAIRASASPPAGDDGAAATTRLGAALVAVGGGDGRLVERVLRDLRSPLRVGATHGRLLPLLDRALGSGVLAELEASLQAARPLVTSRGGTTSVDHQLFSQLTALEVLDELAVSLGEAAPFEQKRERLIGSLAGLRELAPIEGDAIYGVQSAALRAPEETVWILKVPALPDRDADFTLLGSGLDPKTIVDVQLNGVRLIFRNRSAGQFRGKYKVPESIQADGRASPRFLDFTPEGPVPRLITLTRRIPRSALRVGDNRIRLRFIDLPGPLKLPDGRPWDSNLKLSSGTLWHAYVAFPAKEVRR